MPINDEINKDLHRFVSLLCDGTKRQQDDYLGRMRAKYQGQEFKGKQVMMYFHLARQVDHEVPRSEF